MNNNSSGVHVLKINKNVKLSDKFGELTIDSFHPDFGEFFLNLSQSSAKLNLGEANTKYQYNVNRVKLDNKRVAKSNQTTPTKNLITINGEYSSIIIK